jgi:hypothetical protein
MKHTMTGKSIPARLALLLRVAVALVGFMLRARGRETKAGTRAPRTSITQGY